MSNKIQLLGQRPLTVQDLAAEIKSLQYRFALIINTLKDKVFNINSIEDLAAYKNDFVIITDAINKDPRAMQIPDNPVLAGVSKDSITLYSLIMQNDPLLPPDPNGIQLVTAN